MDTKELRKKSEIDLQKTIAEYREKLQQLWFDLSAGKVKNVKEIRRTRKDIAQMTTILHEKKQ